LAETLWQGLVAEPFLGGGGGGGQAARGKLTPVRLPAGAAAQVDEALSVRMDLVREIVSFRAGSARMARAELLPAACEGEVILPISHRALPKSHAPDQGRAERQAVEYPQKADHTSAYSVLPDLKRPGPRLCKQLPALNKAWAEADAAQLLATSKR